MQYRVEGVPKTLVDIYWPVVAPMIKGAIDPEVETLEDVWQALMTDRAMLWLVKDEDITGAFVVTRLPTSLLVWLAGGRDVKGSLEAVESSLKRYAKEQGAEKIMANVRPGLGRMLKNWATIQETVVLNGLETEDAHDDARNAAT